MPGYKEYRINARKESWHTFCNKKRKQCKEKDGVRNEQQKNLLK